MLKINIACRVRSPLLIMRKMDKTDYVPNKLTHTHTCILFCTLYVHGMLASLFLRQVLLTGNVSRTISISFSRYLLLYAIKSCLFKCCSKFYVVMLPCFMLCGKRCIRIVLCMDILQVTWDKVDNNQLRF